MRKVLVIGSGGSGKSTFAAELGERTGLPVIHLDSHFWRAGWQEPPRDEWAARVDELLKRDAWVMDGNYGGTLERRLAACDTVIFLDLPRVLCLWRVVSRSIRYRGRTRPDMAEGCREQLTWEFARWVWAYPRRNRPGVLKRLSELSGGQRVVVLRSRREVRRFLEESV
ncbi:MAG TPA: DNA topology modulation protein [Pyrinomonadaceae bacterium]|jgi:adenylate kinase family enzyme|nr:DNA topology modulation protein [Pyrinomonadaceae bacterium]